VFAHRQVVHRGLRIDLPHTVGVIAPLVGNPIKFSKTRIEYVKTPPMLREDTNYILREVLKFDEEYIQRLRQHRIV
jgi:crotonobetainyl-CoA:carnitine CoA-transferase CaiB-like acyl-CoA transferase